MFRLAAGVAADSPEVSLVMAEEKRPPSVGDLSARRAAVVSCWMCGVHLPARQMVPDGGDWCEQIRWYCKDVRACTERWTSPRASLQAAGASGGS
jgi:hypothetical protein